MQRVPDKGWEGRRAVTKVVGNKEKVNGNTQTEGHKHGNAMDTNNGMGDKVAGSIRPAGSRNYKQGNRKDPGPLQTTLNEFWKGKEKDMRLWLEEMAELKGQTRKLPFLCLICPIQEKCVNFAYGSKI